jgi:hypothetical protein
VSEQVDTKSPASLHELVHQHQLVHSFQSSAAGGEKYSPARPRGTCDQIARAAAKIFESRGSHAYRKKQLGKVVGSFSPSRVAKSSLAGRFQLSSQLAQKLGGHNSKMQTYQI